MIEPHKITTMGDPIAHGKASHIGAYFLRKEIQAAFLAAAAITAVLNPAFHVAAMGTAAKIFGGALGFMLLEAHGFRALESAIASMGRSNPASNFTGKCLNMNPEKPSDGESLYRRAARGICALYGVGLTVIGGFVLVPLVKSAVQTGLWKESLLGFTLAALPALTRLGFGVHRWHNVANGTYQVETFPEPKRRQEQEKPDTAQKQPSVYTAG